MKVDLASQAAKASFPPVPPSTKPTTARVDIIDRVYDPTARSFMLLIRRHDTGTLDTVPATRITVGMKEADLGVG